MNRDVFRLFMRFGIYTADFRALKADAEKRAVSGLFGRRAITNTIAAVILLAAALGLAVLGLAGLDSESLLLTVLGVVGLAAAAAAVLLFVLYEIHALMCASRQLRLNKRAIGLVSLIVNLALVVAVIVAAAMILGSIEF